MTTTKYKPLNLHTTTIYVNSFTLACRASSFPLSTDVEDTFQDKDLEDNGRRLVAVVDKNVEDKLKLVGMVGEDMQLVVELSTGMVDTLLNEVGMKNRELEVGRPEERMELLVLGLDKERLMLVGL